MANLKGAHQQLFRRTPDETFDSLDELTMFCRQQRESSTELWHPPDHLQPVVEQGSVRIRTGSDGTQQLNHWSFSQLCSSCGVNRETINRLSPDTATRVIQETLPGGQKPVQILGSGQTVRSIHGTQYSRLWNVDLLNAVRSAAPEFQPPQKAITGGTGLYAGEEDMFCFLIDPAGWCEIDGDAFAPGLFCWNSEVGRRSLGVQTFWFQQACSNHIVWDAVEVVDFKRKHTGNMEDTLRDVVRIVEDLVARRDARTDGFATLIRRAMQQRVADNSADATSFLNGKGISRTLIRKAVDQLGEEGRSFTLWSLVDVLTRLTQTTKWAGDRVDADLKVSRLLSLVV